jgi:phosphotransferase system HPr-like phosphotransfer protein
MIDKGGKKIVKEVKVELNTVDKVKAFCQESWKIDGDIDIKSDRHIVDAKSIMGIFSLDLTRPLTLVVADDNTDISSLKEFFVEEN